VIGRLFAIARLLVGLAASAWTAYHVLVALSDWIDAASSRVSTPRARRRLWGEDPETGLRLRTALTPAEIAQARRVERSVELVG
jgi:hypothetical protein